MSLLPWSESLPDMSTRLGAGLAAELAEVHPPPVHRIVQSFPRDRIDDIPGRVLQELDQPWIRSRIRPGSRVAITGGSRGIGKIAEILKAVADIVTSWGAAPFIIPAMGSHGRATADGQRQILADYGISEETIGAPVVATMDTVQVGTVMDGVPVYVSADAAAADAIIPVNRIKPHTGYRGRIESGVMKMIAIGLGKQHGAETLHARGMDLFPDLIPLVAECVVSQLPVVCGLGIVENAYEEPARIQALAPESLREQEAALLVEARERLPRMPFHDVDVLVVGALGKNISGAGMDPNVIGRFSRGLPEGSQPTVQVGRIALLDITPESHGNAIGMGVADVSTLRLLRKLDLASVYANAFTAAHLAGAQIPAIMESDRMAIAAAIKTCPGLAGRSPRFAVIRNTLELHELWASADLAEEAARLEHVKVDPHETRLDFEPGGDLVAPIGRRIK